MHPSTFAAAAAMVVSWASTDASKTAHFCNAHLLVMAHDDPAIGAALSGATFVATDGLPLVWLARRLGRPAERVAGPDLMLAVMDLGRAAGVRHYLYGATPGVLQALQYRLLDRLPGLAIVGAAAPPFGRRRDADLSMDLERIRESGADLVWVGLGAPQQDLWVEEARHRIRVGGLLAVGAAFDFHAGTRRRAPRWMQRSGTEWLFRLLHEPRRLWRRYATTNTRFVVLAARQLLARQRRP